MKKTYSDWKLNKTELNGVYKIELSSFEDHRGSYTEIYNKYFFRENNLDINFIQDDISISKKMYLEEYMEIKKPGN